MIPEPAFTQPRPINYGAVVAATIRETSRAEYERRLGEWREQMATWRDFQTARAERVQAETRLGSVLRRVK